MGWYLGEFPSPPVILIPSFLFNFFEKMDTSRDVHWGVDCLEEEGCYDTCSPLEVGKVVGISKTLGYLSKMHYRLGGTT
jgi:hypothetical protein